MTTGSHWLLAIRVLLVSATCCATVGAQGGIRVITSSDIQQLLGAGVVESRILEMLQNACVRGGADRSASEAMRASGASDAFLRALVPLACNGGRAPAMPVLVAGPAQSFGLGDDKFVLIQSGTFEMGTKSSATEYASRYERPAHRVTLTQPFWL